MPKRRMSDDQWINALQECRSSGMTDKDWCAVQGIHPSTLYKAIKRLQRKACAIPAHEPRTVSVTQEVVEVASADENGVLKPVSQIETAQIQRRDQSISTSDNSFDDSSFETSVRISMPSGIRVELSNNADAAAIRNILGVLQSV